MAVDANGNQIIDPPEDNLVQKRITDLSTKVKETSQERDEARTAAETAKAEKAEAIKERDFYASFSDVVSAHPAAKDHKDEILAKVKTGYDVEDAAVAVLNKAGKLTPKPVEKVSPAGGSAATAITGAPDKTVKEMTQAERKAALTEAEQRGDLSSN